VLAMLTLRHPSPPTPRPGSSTGTGERWVIPRRRRDSRVLRRVTNETRRSLIRRLLSQEVLGLAGELLGARFRDRLSEEVFNYLAGQRPPLQEHRDGGAT
jgi:hypothetical protein